MKLLLVIACHLLLAQLISAEEGGDIVPEKPSDVVILTDSNFKELTNGKDWFVKFYAPWCGFCKALAPTWDEFATTLKTENSPVNVGKVDCTVNTELCSIAYKISSYPTLLLLTKGGEVERYEGERKIESFKNFVADIEKFSSLSHKIEKTLAYIWDDVKPLYEKKKNACAIIFFAGFFANILLGKVLSLFGGKKSARPNKKKSQ